MKLVSFEIETPIGKADRLGVIADRLGDNIVVDLNIAFEHYLKTMTSEPTPREYAQLRMPPDMIAWLRAGHEGLAAARSALEFAQNAFEQDGRDRPPFILERSDIKLMAPLRRPVSFRAFSSYAEHMTRAQFAPMVLGNKPYRRDAWWYRVPQYYKGSCGSFAGPDDPVPFPYYTDYLDLEIELAIVVGKEGRNLSPDEAQDYIAGYSILVNSTCRDGYQREPFGPAKRKDFHTALGPCLVTSDELDVRDLACSIEVDGEVWFSGSTASPHNFTPAQLVAFASDNETLVPGDLISTGTIGLGCSMDHHRWVQVGQTASFTIAGIGSMALRIVPGEHVVDHVRGMGGLLQPPPDLQ